MRSASWLPFLLATTPLACAERAPTVLIAGAPAAPVAPAGSAAPRPERTAEQYALGDWTLGKPTGALASLPDLWNERHVEGNASRRAVMFGKRHRDPQDPLQGAHLGFLGPAPADGGETAFVPTSVIALGSEALRRFRPPLEDPPKSMTGSITFEMDVPLSPPGDEEAPAATTAHLACRASRVCTITTGGRFLGYVLGEVPKEAGDRYFKGVGRFVETHLGLR